MDYLIFFAIVMATSFFFPELMRKFHIPYVTAIMVSGMIIGPYGLGITEIGEAAEFLAALGVIFLMFSAGLDVKLSTVKEVKGKILGISLLNAGIPFVIGYLIAIGFGYGIFTGLLLGTVFSSSSVGVVIPTLKELGLLKTNLGETTIMAVIFEDIGSLLMLAILLHLAMPSVGLSTPVFFAAMFIFLVVVLKILPKLEKMYIRRLFGKDEFERELRFVFIILVVMSLYAELIGLHAIVAGFLVGLVLSEVIKDREVYAKIHTIGYGFLIPIFFLVVGMKTDITVLWESRATLLLITIVGSLVTAKLFSGWIGARIAGFSKDECWILGASTIPQLSTTLAVAVVALNAGLFDSALVTSIVVLSLVTTLVAPLLVTIFKTGWNSPN